MARQSKADRDIIKEAQDRFRAADEWERTSRNNFRQDQEFANGDSYNNYQWPQEVLLGRQRSGQPRPCLTFNKISQHCKHVVNAARQNQMGIKVNAVGFGATSEAAEALEGMIRHIEYQSNAQQNAYLAAIKPQVECGIGWWHVTTDWAPGDTFDQELYIRSVPNALSVWSDPDCLEPDHSDMRWAMIGEDMPRKTFEAKYPDYKDLAGTAPLIGSDLDRAWTSHEKVRVMRYYRRNETQDTLYVVPPMTMPGPVDNDGSPVVDPMSGAPPPGRQEPGGIMRESDMPDDVLAARDAAKDAGAPWQSRDITGHQVEYFDIVGREVIDEGETVFDHIPLVPVLGDEIVIDGRMDRKGHTRAMIDAQRMYNYSASEYTALVGLQARTPWLADVRAIEGYEDVWASANTTASAFLPYNSSSPDGDGPIPPPQRLEPPTTPTAAVQGMATAEQQMQIVSGQYDAEIGAQSNERTGTAIQQRQRQGETATYHFTDAQGAALRLTGKILIGAIPKVYDVQRAVQILAADGTRKPAVIDPALPTAHQMVPPPGQSEDHEDAILAVNPTVGRYDVEADVGPAYGTRRQEAFNAIQQVLIAAPALVEKAGDLLFKAADFPLADQIAERLAPPGDDPNAAAAMQQIQQLHGQVAQLTQKLSDKQGELSIKVSQQQHDKVDDVMRADLDRYKAETDRMAAIGSIDPALLAPIVSQLVADALRTHLGSGQVPQTPMADTMPGGAGPMPPGAAPPMNTGLPRLATANPPGGAIHGPVPTPGSVQ